MGDKTIDMLKSMVDDAERKIDEYKTSHDVGLISLIPLVEERVRVLRHAIDLLSKDRMIYILYDAYCKQRKEK